MFRRIGLKLVAVAAVFCVSGLNAGGVPNCMQASVEEHCTDFHDEGCNEWFGAASCYAWLENQTGLTEEDCDLRESGCSEGECPMQDHESITCVFVESAN